MPHTIGAKHVKAAIKEYDRLTEDVFLKRYGFGKAKEYFLIYNGKKYASKAIVGAAYRFKDGLGKHLSPSQLWGGKGDAAKVLKSLGFEVVRENNLFDSFESNEGIRKHVSMETSSRNKKIITQKKQNAYEKFGFLACEVCEFDYRKVYGIRGDLFIEAHHISPLSEAKGGRITKLSDLCLLCANCHRMMHRGPLLSVGKLKIIVKSQRSV